MVEALALILLALLGARFYQLQVLDVDQYRQRARLNTVVVERTAAPRGRILDCHGQLLVTNAPRYELDAVPVELNHVSSTAHLLAEALGSSSQPLRRKLAHNLAPLEPVHLKTSLTTQQLARVSANPLAGVSVEVRSQRRYHYGPLAAHTLGTMGRITAEQLAARKGKGYNPDDLVGQTGIEEQYESVLRGKKGISLRYVDALGRTVSVEQERSPIAGPDAYLTLDLNLQRFVEAGLARQLDALEQKNHQRNPAAAVVLEVQTGRVLALASLPGFDPAPFARGIRPAEFNSLVRDRHFPLLSRATQSSYPPGSTFKLVNASASLQEHLCTPSSTFYCGGWYKGFHCFVQSGHGTLSFAETLAQSCDVTYYRLGDELGIGRLSRYARIFGLGHATGLDVPDETDGFVGDPAWKRKAYKDRWYEGDTINMGIGQGYIQASPLQMAVVTAAVANGGRLYRPYLLDKLVARNGAVRYRARPHLTRRLPIRASFLAAVRDGMRGVVTHGTATAANSPTVEIAGKTGTADSGDGNRNHTWFVSFAPYRHPRIATVVMFEKAGGFGGSVAAPVVREIDEYYFAHHGAP